MIKLNGHVIEPTIFPDGTSQVWKIGEYVAKPGHHCMPIQRVEWWFENEAELMHLAQLKMLLDKDGTCNAELYMPYCPYARQDKAIDDGQTFALSTFLGQLWGMHWSLISTIDMHNPDFVDQFDFNWQNNKMTPDVSRYDTVIFPDAGAASRYDMDHPNIAIGHKVRDPKTGWITEYRVEGNVFGNVIVVDDLCDGGMTFELLAKSIIRSDPEGIKRLDLSVTHGIFSKGLDKLCIYYDTIFTTNSFFGHTVRSGDNMLQLLEDAGDDGYNPKSHWYANLWKYVQQQQLVIEGV